MSLPDLTEASLADLVSLEGRTAVITGGAAGIGAAIARRFDEAGAHVTIADLDLAAAEKTASELSRAAAVHLDASNSRQNIEVAEGVVEEHGRLDIWVNNAGIYPFVDLVDMTPEQWHTVISLNLDGVFFGSRAAMRPMVAAGRGVIINLASTAAYGAEGGGIAHYTASKHGVRGFTKALAFELGPSGVRAVALAPTLVETPGTLADRDAISAGMGVENAHDAFAEQIPARRIGYPDDVARVAYFLASDLAAFVSGDTILVDGGLRSR
ncbi:SDR family NAD(P)-dependent oxidoreductase [Euzebya tangerina]|uniref:SDR family NAD(P)-dependent oxidoreductase n=1 Tax=Euzebya tangerina TaxID=591198 RepID=UPI000E321E0C|nr:SDR family NAD(P)-dependent oxidoreductase [Euzebya tangerina]